VFLLTPDSVPGHRVMASLPCLSPPRPCFWSGAVPFGRAQEFKPRPAPTGRPQSPESRAPEGMDQPHVRGGMIAQQWDHRRVRLHALRQLQVMERSRALTGQCAGQNSC